MRALLAFLLVLSGCAAASEWEAHFAARMGVLNMHVQTAGTGKTLLLGDSNTEAFWWNTAGVCVVVNAGLGGATIRDVAERAADIADITRPRLVHVMIGTNNVFQTPSHPQWPTMKQDLTRIVDAFWSRGINVVLWPIPPVAGHATQRAGVNEAIWAVSTEKGVMIDWWWPETLTLNSLLLDGVHLTHVAQASRRARIDVWQQYLKSALGIQACG